MSDARAMSPPTWARVVNGLAALALAAFVVGAYWPTVKTFDLYRADLGYRGEWLGGHARRITAVEPEGAMARAGLKRGDVIQFDPANDDDWVLAGYRNMAEGFRGALPVRHPDGTASVVTLVPERRAYLPTLNDRLALLARLAGLTTIVLIGVALVWARPCLMTWSILLTGVASSPARVWTTSFLAFAATPGGSPLQHAVTSLIGFAVFILAFAFSFPNDTLTGWSRWQRALGLAGAVLTIAVFGSLGQVPFESNDLSLWINLWAVPVCAVGMIALARSYRRSDSQGQARLKWAMLGFSAFLAALLAGLGFAAASQVVSVTRSGNPLSPAHWTFFVGQGVIFPLVVAYAVLRRRVIDVQFAVSRTLVYGVVSTLVLVFLTVLHWLLGRVIEHAGLAFGLEGLAAIGLGLVLHRASHRINLLVDRVLFHKHHAAEERLKRVTAALPFASTEQSIAQAIVDEPVLNLQLASAALFYRDSSEGPLRRVRSEGWSDSHASSLDPESLLVRYLHAEHQAVRLDEEQQWLPPGMPEGSAHPVLAVPIVAQHELSAVVLYGAHVNATLPDPDEVDLLSALARAAATSHQQVRIATLMRANATLAQEHSALLREREIEKARNDQLTALLRERVVSASESIG